MYRRFFVLAVVVALLGGCAGNMRLGHPEVGKLPSDAGVLAISSNVAGAEVYVDDKLVGTIMRADRFQDFIIDGGEHELTIKKFGYEEWKHDIMLTAGARNTIQVTMQRTPTKMVEIK